MILKIIDDILQGPREQQEPSPGHIA